MCSRQAGPRQPSRLRVKDELGMPKTPMEDHDLTATDPAGPWLVLGLGPDPAVLAAEIPEDADVTYIECPAFLEQAGADFARRIPAAWRRTQAVDPDWSGSMAFSIGRRHAPVPLLLGAHPDRPGPRPMPEPSPAEPERIVWRARRAGACGEAPAG